MPRPILPESFRGSRPMPQPQDNILHDVQQPPELPLYPLTVAPPR